MLGHLADEHKPGVARKLNAAYGLEDHAEAKRALEQLRMTLAPTNVIESAFAIVERVCSNVKRWHGGDQRGRWVASGLLVAEKQFRRGKGHQQIPVLLRELESLAPTNRVLAKNRKAS